LTRDIDGNTDGTSNIFFLAANLPLCVSQIIKVQSFLFNIASHLLHQTEPASSEIPGLINTSSKATSASNFHRPISMSKHSFEAICSTSPRGIRATGTLPRRPRQIFVYVRNCQGGVYPSIFIGHRSKAVGVLRAFGLL
jgi:hypothetical protein